MDPYHDNYFRAYAALADLRDEITQIMQELEDRLLEGKPSAEKEALFPIRKTAPGLEEE